MKRDKIKFMKRIIALLFIFLAGLLLLNYFYFEIVIPQKNIYKSHSQYLDSLNDNQKIIFFGDSHPALDINPVFINNSFNYAVPSETYEQTFYKIRKVLIDNNSVELFVLPLDPHSFSNYRGDPYKETWHWQYFMTPDELKSATSSSGIKLFISQKFPFIGRGDEIIKLFFSKERTEIILGWQKNENDFSLEKNKNLVSINRLDLQLANFPEHINQQLLIKFIDSVELLSKHNKSIVIIKYPLTQEYLSAINSKEINITEFYVNITKLLSKYDHVYVLDYQKKYKNNHSLFSDPDHFNHLGAEVFSKELSSDLNSLNGVSSSLSGLKLTS